MKSLVYRGPGLIEFDSVPDPVLTTPGSAIIQITMCGICGSDLHAYHVDNGHRDYCIGHEAVGEVMEVGSEVTRFSRGDRVLVSGVAGCGMCSPCRQGMAMLCEIAVYPRIFGQGFGLGGCQAEAVEVPVADANLFALSPGLSDEVGIMLTDNLPSAWECCIRGDVRPGASVAVIGLGAVGLQCVITAFALGAERVFALDLLPDRRDAARALGATLFDEEAAEQILTATDSRGVDCVLDATGGPVTAGIAVQLARKGGSIAILGVPEALTIDFPALFALSKNLRVAFVSCSIPAQLPGVLAAIEDGRIDPASVAGLVTHHLPLARGAEAYALFDAKRDGVKKVVMVP